MSTQTLAVGVPSTSERRRPSRSWTSKWRAIARLAIRMVTHNKLKTIGTLLGVVFAVILSNQQAGVFLGLLSKNVLFVDNSKADIWITPTNTEQLQSGALIPMSVLHRALVTPGVQRATPLIFSGAQVALPNGGSEAVTLVGTKVSNEMGVPFNQVVGDARVLNRPDTMIFEDSERDKLGSLNVGSVREVSGHRVVVGGFTWGLLPFGPSYAFADYDTARLLTRIDTNHTHFVLVKVAPGEDPNRVARVLQTRIPDAKVMTTQQFSKSIVTFLLTKSPIGVTFGSSTLMGLIVGFVIVALSMFSSVVDNLREFGTLKAIGATNWNLAVLLWIQAIVFALVGSLSGIFVVSKLAEAIRSPKLGMYVTPPLMLGTTVLMILLCIAASTLALFRIRKVEPGMVFR